MFLNKRRNKGAHVFQNLYAYKNVKFPPAPSTHYKKWWINKKGMHLKVLQREGVKVSLHFLSTTNDKYRGDDKNN
jgi:hypothetical protein